MTVLRQRFSGGTLVLASDAYALRCPFPALWVGSFRIGAVLDACAIVRLWPK